MSEEAFQPYYIDTSNHTDYFEFEDALFDFSVNTAVE